MWNPKEDKKVQSAVQKYLLAMGLTVDGETEFLAGIDHVCVRVNGVPVLAIGLPPVSNYLVEETEHTRKYLRTKLPIAI